VLCKRRVLDGELRSRGLEVTWYELLSTCKAGGTGEITNIGGRTSGPLVTARAFPADLTASPDPPLHRPSSIIPKSVPCEHGKGMLVVRIRDLAADAHIKSLLGKEYASEVH
jgi:hypothetical protein